MKLIKEVVESTKLVVEEKLGKGKTYFIEKDYYDEKDFPNIIENGYEYFN